MSIACENIFFLIITILFLIRSQLTSIPDTVAGLFLSLECNPIPEFLFSLPLYWLVVKGGELAKCVPHGVTNNFRLSRSCLPLISKVKWEKIQTGLCEYHPQRLVMKFNKLTCYSIYVNLSTKTPKILVVTKTAHFSKAFCP